MVPVADHLIIEMDVTSMCEERCSHCTRMVADRNSKTHFELTPEQLERALRSLQGWQGKGNGRAIVGFIGGNPTLHSQFRRMCEVFRANWGPREPLTRGREAIRDMPKYLMDMQSNFSSKRVLFTNVGKKSFYRVMEHAFDTFSWIQANTHEHQGLHRAMNLGRQEYNRLTGQSDDEWLRNRDECGLQRDWSPSVTQHGAYFCEVAGTIDDLWYEGKHAWEVRDGWWKRGVKDYHDQIHLCDHCSIAQKRLPEKLDNEEVSIITQDTLEVLRRVESPSILKGKYELFDPVNNPQHAEHGHKWHTECYVEVPPSQQAYVRMPLSNRWTHPRHVDAVVVCVGRAKDLMTTLPRNVDQVRDVTVVTSPEDTETQAVVGGLQELRGKDRVRLVVSDSYKKGEATFNKGAMLNAGCASLLNPDWVVFLDADVFLSPEFRDFVHDHVLNVGCLHYTSRTDVRMTGGEFQALPQPHGKKLEMYPSGYFQLFNRLASAVADDWPNVCSEAYPSAAGVDRRFACRWDPRKLVPLPAVGVLHLAHASVYGQHWNGHASRPGTWVQHGIARYDLGGLHLLDPRATLRPGQLLKVFHVEADRTIECRAGSDGKFPSDVLFIQNAGGKVTIRLMGTNLPRNNEIIVAAKT